MARRKKVEPLEIVLKPENVSRESCALSRDFAYAQLTNNDMVKWSKTQKQLFLLVLEQLDWTRRDNKTLIELDNQEVALRMGWEYSYENERKIKQVIEAEITDMWNNSKIELRDPISGSWYKDHVISTAGGNALKTFVSISPWFINHFQGMYQLSAQTGASFPVLMSTDVLSFKSSLTYNFYLKLRLEGVTGGPINTKELSDYDIKNILQIDKDAYMRVSEVLNKATGKKELKRKIDRNNFEKYVLNVVLEDINKSETIQIIKSPDGKLFEKIKIRGKVAKYRIRYRIFDVKTIKKHREYLIKKLSKEDTSESLKQMGQSELNQLIKDELSYSNIIDTETYDNTSDKT